MADSELQLVARRIRSFPDFPVPGVLFRCGRVGRVGRADGRRSGAPEGGGSGRGPGPTPGVTRPALAYQGHLAPPEGPRLLPRLH